MPRALLGKLETAKSTGEWKDAFIACMNAKLDDGKKKLVTLEAGPGAGKSTAIEAMVSAMNDAWSCAILAVNFSNVHDLRPSLEKLQRTIDVASVTDVTEDLAFKKSIGKYNVIIVDEAQDLSDEDGKILLQRVNKNGYLILFGDKHQHLSVCRDGFAICFELTAGDSSWGRWPHVQIKRTLRLSPSIVAIANGVHSMALEAAPVPKLAAVSAAGQLTELVALGDMVVCMTVADVVSVMKELSNKKLVVALSMDPQNVRRLRRLLIHCSEDEDGDLMANCGLLREWVEAARPSKEFVLSYLQSDFLVSPSSSVLCGTIADTKGHARNRVFIYKPSSINIYIKNLGLAADLSAAQTLAKNLLYVAVTRARVEVAIVDNLSSSLLQGAFNEVVSSVKAVEVVPETPRGPPEPPNPPPPAQSQQTQGSPRGVISQQPNTTAARSAHSSRDTTYDIPMGRYINPKELARRKAQKRSNPLQCWNCDKYLRTEYGVLTKCPSIECRQCQRCFGVEH